MKQTTNKVSAANAAVLSDIQTLRKRTRKNIEEGAVAKGYGANRKKVIRLLNEALATELACVSRSPSNDLAPTFIPFRRYAR